MITYNDIYEALRKEKYSEQLQPLNEKFLLEVQEYLEDKKNVTEKKTDVFSDMVTKTKKQLENAVSIFRELMLRRKKKILNLAFIAKETGISKRDFENMLEQEREMFDKIVKSMEECDSSIYNIMNGKEVRKNVLVSFKENTEKFLDVDGEILGPFEKGELANLPEEIAKILVDAKKAEIIEEE